MNRKNYNKTYIFFIAAAFCLFTVQLNYSYKIKDNTKTNINNTEYIDDLIERLKENNIDSYEWNINEENSWEDLHIFLPKAKVAGISVSINLLPPTMTPPLCDTCNYSEPYREDYKKWAEEIAKLSLRYSNLKSFTIANLQENINLNYLTYNDLDSLAMLATSVNPKLNFKSIPRPKDYNLFYVDRYAKGDGSGKDWENAAPSLAKLNWSKIEGGDTIYVSGGVDSVIYGTVFLYKRIFTSPLVITKGIDAGHSGKVIFQNTEPIEVSSTFNVNACENVRLTNVTINTTTTTDDVDRQKTMFIAANGKNNSMDNCDIISNGLGTCVFIIQQTNFSLTNSRLIVQHNDYLSDADCIFISGGNGGHTISNNILINDKANSSARHPDIIQFANEGSASKPLTVIANNLMMSYYKDIDYNSGINITDNMGPNSFLVYNNIIAMISKSSIPIRFSPLSGAYPMSLTLLNNTILTKGNGYSIQIGNVDSLTMKNNIVIIDTSIAQMTLWFSDLSGFSAMPYYKDIDYNLYWKTTGAYSGIIIDTTCNNGCQKPDGGRPSFAQWQSLGYDINSNVDSVVFVNRWGSNIEDYNLEKGSPGINDGVDLPAYFTTDILKALRSKGAWDKGALEK